MGSLLYQFQSLLYSPFIPPSVRPNIYRSLARAPGCESPVRERAHSVPRVRFVPHKCMSIQIDTGMSVYVAAFDTALGASSREKHRERESETRRASAHRQELKRIHRDLYRFAGFVANSMLQRMTGCEILIDQTFQ